MRVIVFLIVSIFVPTAAFAYIGPGAGLGAIGTLIALIGALLFIIIGFIWYPLKRLFRKRQARVESSARNNTEVNK